MPQPLIQKIASPDVIRCAFEWVCECRKKYHHNHDIWHLRVNWERIMPTIRADLIHGRYLFEPVRRVRTSGGVLFLWSARDALVLKAVAVVLGDSLGGAQSGARCPCADVEGCTGALSAVLSEVGGAEFATSTDLNGCCGQVNHDLLMGEVCKRVDDAMVIDLIWKYLEILVDVDAVLKPVTQGILHGSPLSPVMMSLYSRGNDDGVTARGWPPEPAPRWASWR